MNNLIRMNQFLQRMLRKSEEEEISGEMGHFERVKSKRTISSRRNINRSSYDNPNRSSLLTRKSSFSRPAWMKKLGSSFDQPTKTMKLQIPKSPMQPEPSKPLYIPKFENSPSFRRTKTLPASLNVTPNTQNIIRDFESDSLSPKLNLEPGSGNFVKKIVAAFEERYKCYNDTWTDRVRGKLKDSGFHRHSYSNINQSLHFTSVEISKSTETLKSDYSNNALNTKYKKSETSKIKPNFQNPTVTYYSHVKPQNSPSSEINDDSTLERKEREPIIIGAFLKKPVKVDETSINWIPFPGKKLPRKKSLKKLLNVLSGKKTCEKKNEIIFSSQINVNEETRELPDSGYDEQSVSSNSLTSVISNSEIIREKRIYANTSAIGNWSTSMININRRSTNLSTFQTRGQIEVDDDESDTFSVASKKLLLYEVPREELKADLGPCYPAPSRIMVKSLDRKVPQKNAIIPSLPKHPLSSKIPKHPFISLSKDELNEVDDYNQVELRKSRKTMSSFQSFESEYDIPRKLLSKSEPGITDMLQFTFNKCLDETDYDVPKIRPKSSVYEDALSLKRRNNDSINTPGSPQDYYSSPSENGPQFATIRSRNRRFLSPTFFNSTNELRSNPLHITSL